MKKDVSAAQLVLWFHTKRKKVFKISWNEILIC